MLTKLSQNPHESNLSIIFNDLISLHSANERHKVVDKVRIFSQNVLKHLDGFRGHVGDLKAEEVLKLGAYGLG